MRRNQSISPLVWEEIRISEWAPELVTLLGSSLPRGTLALLSELLFTVKYVSEPVSCLEEVGALEDFWKHEQSCPFSCELVVRCGYNSLKIFMGFLRIDVEM